MTSPVTGRPPPRPVESSGSEQTDGKTSDIASSRALFDQMIKQATDDATADEKKRHDKVTKNAKDNKADDKEDDDEEEEDPIY